MRSGTLNRQITLQQRVATVDTFGQRSLTWVDVAPTWAEIAPLTGRELEAAQAIHSEVSHQVTIRYRPGVTAAMRAVYQGRFFQIQAVLDTDTRHEQMLLMCSEGTNDGQ